MIYSNTTTEELLRAVASNPEATPMELALVEKIEELYDELDDLRTESAA